eukprot:TRINITY_DN3688_c0_g1_i1.p2 TRINITY_DN3688_c0_g1~~TRINITY_DN3688_c0_g1_i1.p2  ORF type:complete len:312 (+),score=155.66 TRINITY_DN3688_c0_g1_i1:125-1060(+)
MSEMFVKSKAAPQAAGDVRQQQGNRLTDNGMNRDTTDKNAVDDEYDFAAMRANLGKKKTSPKPASEQKLAQAKARTGLEPGGAVASNQMFVGGTAANVRDPAVATAGQDDEEDFNALRSRLKKNPSGVKMTETAAATRAPSTQKQQLQQEPEEELDIAALRANLGKKNKPADQMYVVEKKEAQAAGDVREQQGNRLTNNGMNRDTTDKNAVEDEHDFAAMRANLGKKNVKTDDARVARAKAMFEDSAEPAPEPQVSVFVGKKKAPQAASDVRQEQGNRLTNNGMNRDRTDQNAVEDESDFASLRANLKKVA